MTNAKILVVEDEIIVAKDIQNRLNRLGYEVPGIAASAEEAIMKTVELQPDLVLMDIVLRGDKDGVEAAEQIRSRFRIPVIYLTAYSDELALQRAKATEPFGYLLKPFKERELHTTIAMALYRHEMEQKLEENQKWLAATLRSIGDAVIATDSSECIRFMNPVAETLTGWKQEDALGKDLKKVFNIKNEKTRAPVESPVTRALSEGKIVGLANHTIIIASHGKETHLDDCAAPIRDDRGNATGAVLVFRDITERKRAEEALRRSEEQLRHAQKMEAIGGLAGGVAHDFNNILTAILGTAELAIMDLHPDHPVRHDMEDIKRSAERAANLTRQLLAFARRQTITPRTLNLNDLLLNLNKMLRRLIGEDIELVIRPAQNLDSVEVDPGQIEQVIINLAVNARDAMPKGGKLVLQTGNVELDDEPARQHAEATPGNYVLLTIRDTGHGMTEEVKAHLFEPFFTTKETGKGTGLGLATCYGIVKQSGGFITAESVPGQGATFRIFLPGVEDAPALSSERDQTELLPQGTETVLLVEDEELVRTVAARTLSQQGYTVLEAADGNEALQAAQAHAGEAIHILVTDVIMPKISGSELAMQLQALYPEMKVLFMSGYNNDAILRHGAFDASVAFLQKPFSPALLAHRIREVLDKDVKPNS